MSWAESVSHQIDTTFGRGLESCSLPSFITWQPTKRNGVHETCTSVCFAFAIVTGQRSVKLTVVKYTARRLRAFHWALIETIIVTLGAQTYKFMRGQTGEVVYTGQFNSILYNSIQFNCFIPESTGQIHVVL